MSCAKSASRRDSRSETPDTRYSAQKHPRNTGEARGGIDLIKFEIGGACFVILFSFGAGAVIRGDTHCLLVIVLAVFDGTLIGPGQCSGAPLSVRSILPCCRHVHPVGPVHRVCLGTEKGRCSSSAPHAIFSCVVWRKSCAGTANRVQEEGLTS